MHQQHRRQILTQNLQIAQVANTVLFALARSLNGARQGRKDDGRVLRVLLDQLVEDQMLRSAGEVVEAEWHGLLEGKTARGGILRHPGTGVVGGLAVVYGLMRSGFGS